MATTRSRGPTILLAAAVLAGADPARGQELRYAFEKDIEGQYRTRSTTVLSGAGYDEPVTSSIEYFVRYRIEGVAGGRARIAFEITRIVAETRDPTAESTRYDSDRDEEAGGLLAMLPEFVGKTVRMTVDPRGAISDLQVPAAISTWGGDTLVGGIAAFPPELPAERIGIGGTWTSAVDRPAYRGPGPVRHELVAREGTTVTISGVRLPAEETGAVKLEKAGGTVVIDLAHGIPVRAEHASRTRLSVPRQDGDVILEVTSTLVRVEAEEKGR